MNTINASTTSVVENVSPLYSWMVTHVSVFPGLATCTPGCCHYESWAAEYKSTWLTFTVYIAGRMLYIFAEILVFELGRVVFLCFAHPFCTVLFNLVPDSVDTLQRLNRHHLRSSLIHSLSPECGHGPRLWWASIMERRVWGVVISELPLLGNCQGPGFRAFEQISTVVSGWHF